MRCHHVDYRLGIARLERAIETLRHHHVANPRRADHQYFHAELLCVTIQPGHVFRYAFGNGFERFIVTRRAQIRQICLVNAW